MKIIKTLIVMLSSVSLFASANAGELGVSGTAKATYNILSGQTNVSKGIGITNELNFTASGELDNGYTWSYSMELDPDAVAADNGAAQNDDTKLTVSTPYGTFGVFVSEGGLDVEDAGSQSVYARPTDMGDPSATSDNYTIDSYNNIQYHTPAGLLPYGITAKIGYAPSTNTGADDYQATGAARSNTASNLGTTAAGGLTVTAGGNSVSHYQVKANELPFLDGLSIGADYLEFGGVEGANSQAPSSGAYFATYVMGPATIGYSKGYLATAIGASADVLESIESTKYSISANVSDDLSISYEHEESNPDFTTAATANYTLESTGIQAAYTMGGMTLAIAMNDHENAKYQNGVDIKDTVFSVAMAF